jgi:hypothetical protein
LILDRVTFLREYPPWFYQCLCVPGCLLTVLVQYLPFIVIFAPVVAFLAVFMYVALIVQILTWPFSFLYFWHQQSANARLQACHEGLGVLLFKSIESVIKRVFDNLESKPWLVKCFFSYISCGLFSSLQETDANVDIRPRNSRCVVWPFFFGCLGRRLISNQHNHDRACRYHKISSDLFRHCLEKRELLYPPDDIRILELLVPAGRDPVESLLRQQRVLGCDHKIVAQTQMYLSSKEIERVHDIGEISSNSVSASRFLTCFEQFETISLALGLLHPETLSILLEVAVQLKSKRVLDWTKTKMERSIRPSHPLFHKYEVAANLVSARVRRTVNRDRVSNQSRIVHAGSIVESSVFLRCFLFFTLSVFIGICLFLILWLYPYLGERNDNVGQAWTAISVALSFVTITLIAILYLISLGPLYPTHLAPKILEKLRAVDSLVGPPSKSELWRAKSRRFFYRSAHLDLDLFRIPDEMAILSKVFQSSATGGDASAGLDVFVAGNHKSPASHHASATAIVSNSMPGGVVVSNASLPRKACGSAASANHLPPKISSVKHIPSVSLPTRYLDCSFPYLMECLDFLLIPTPIPCLPPLRCAGWLLLPDFFPAAIMAMFHIVPVRCDISRLICRRAHPTNDSPSNHFCLKNFHNLEQSIVNHALLSGGDEARAAIDVIASSNATDYCFLRVLFDVFLKIALHEELDAQSEIGELWFGFHDHFQYFVFLLM